MLSVSLCFSMEMSAFFAAVGLFSSWWIYSRTSNGQLASGVFFFFTMEFLQVIQYYFIAPNIDSPICETTINKVRWAQTHTHAHSPRCLCWLQSVQLRLFASTRPVL